ncbi:MAG: serine acetyltransferase [Ruminococcaceae bacterium]|nr:serine acetyltransferase [Oscillospiraceae bacterium]
MKDSSKLFEDILSGLQALDKREYDYFHSAPNLIPSRKEIISILKDIQSIMFPDYFYREENTGKTSVEILENIYNKLKIQITAAFSFCSDCNKENDSDMLAEEIMKSIPCIKEMLIKDVQAIYEGDPAARAPEEVILSYPGFYAISIYRVAHEFYIRKIPYLARLMTEFAHEKTGIDIHSGATIGEKFFIDHGTGIVIGETTTIGNNVRIYQGVTLGAKSFELDENGNPIKGIKRHPDIGNNCIIYANATILGGNTKIGDGCVIGGNVWLTHSVPAGEVVYYNAK